MPVGRYKADPSSYDFLVWPSLQATLLTSFQTSKMTLHSWYLLQITISFMPVNEFGCSLYVPEAKPQMLCTSRDVDNGNDVQHTGKICRLINCPKNMVGRVTGKKGKTVKAIERAFSRHFLD